MGWIENGEGRRKARWDGKKVCKLTTLPQQKKKRRKREREKGKKELKRYFYNDSSLLCYLHC
jgi:hypothetical protein